ncbi:DUF4870 domain-containing protein [Candidatus Parvarchaeota archaeon]|nr:DUF4870 domain-containing protein [Candidatus Parvarchaeota archaeon]
MTMAKELKFTQEKPEGKSEGKRPDFETKMAALSYASAIITSFAGPLAIYFAAKPDDSYTRKNASTAALFAVAEIVLFTALLLVLAVVYFAVGFVAKSFQFYALVFCAIVFLFVVAVLKAALVFLAYKAYNGEPAAIPLLSKYAEKFE